MPPSRCVPRSALAVTPPDRWVVPAEATIRRALARADPTALAAVIGAWLADRDRPAQQHRRRAVAVDGKTLRGANRDDGRQVHLLAAMDHATRAVLAQRHVDGAPGRGPRAWSRCWPAWTWPVSWSPPTRSRPTPTPPGFLVTGKQAHYLLVVKANQPTLLGRCARLAWQRVPVLDRTRDHAHGRVELRTLKAVTVHHFGLPHAAQAHGRRRRCSRYAWRHSAASGPRSAPPLLTGAGLTSERPGQ
jgi:hypothetical protein